MSRKLLLSSISIAAAASLIGVGAYAKYSDKEVGGPVSVTAGTLNLEVGGSAVGHNFDVTNAYPGFQSPGLFGYVLKNTGTIDGQLHVFLVKDSDAENSMVEPETDAPDIDPASGEIDNYLNVTVDGNSFGYGGTVPWMGLATMLPGNPVDVTGMIWGGPSITIPAGGQYPGVELWFGYAISPDATNAIMTDTLGFHLEFTLEQV
jgi:predicted ribosomally synthesized peptide with SipW-like signal peptide